MIAKTTIITSNIIITIYTYSNKKAITIFMFSYFLFGFFLDVLLNKFSVFFA